MFFVKKKKTLNIIHCTEEWSFKKCIVRIMYSELLSHISSKKEEELSLICDNE